MNDVKIVSFATKPFLYYQKELQNSAKEYNINNFNSYNDNWLQSTAFYKKYYKIFKIKRGFGLWLWKPYIIKCALEEINEGEIIFYIDSGSRLIADPKPIIEIARIQKHGIVSFDCFPIKNINFVSRLTFQSMNCDNSFYWESKHVIATVLLIRKNKFTIDFVDEWLEACTNIDNLKGRKDVANNSNEQYNDFIAHREDQSILSLLIAKYGIETYRNPSKWGNFLKLSQFRVKDELICYPYFLKNSIQNYSMQPYFNSPFGTIFEFNLFKNKNEFNKFFLFNAFKYLYKRICPFLNF